jgi:PAS domain S-box-containing protein
LNNTQNIEIPDYLKNSSTYLVVATDLTGNITYYNQAYFILYKNIIKNDFKANIMASIHPDDTDIIIKAVEKCLQNKFESTILQIRKPLANTNRYSWTHWEFSAILNKENEPEGIMCMGIDLTENFEMFENIKEFSERVETIIQNLTDGFFVLDKDWRFKSSNAISEKYLGKSKFELVEGSFWDIEPEIENSNLGRELKRSMETKTSFQFTDYFSRVNQWLRVTIYYSEKGIAVFLRDITTEHTIEEKLIVSEMRLNALVDSSTSINVLISPDKKIMHFNKIADKIALTFFGKKLEEGESFEQYVPEILKDKFEYSIAESLIGNEVSKEEFLQINNTPGIWHKVSYKPVYNRKEIIGISFNAENIHQSKIIELENNYLNKILTALYNSSRYSKLMISKDYNVIFFNRVASAFVKREFGVNMERNGNVFNYINDEIRPDFKLFIDQALNGRICETEYLANFPKSGKAWIRLEIYPVYDENKEVIGVSYNAIDISSRKLDRLTIEDQSKRLKEIAFTQSHIIRKPVANMIGLINLFESENLTEENKFILSKLQESLSELDHVIYDLVGKSVSNNQEKPL